MRTALREALATTGLPTSALPRETPWPASPKAREDKEVNKEGRSLSSSGPSSALIHRSAWNRNSRKFAVASYSSTRLQPLDNRPYCSPPAPKLPDLVAVVAPFCIKELRLVTMQLPEKFSPIGVGTNRSSHIRLS